MAFNRYGEKILGVKIVMREHRSPATGKRAYIVGVYINNSADPVVVSKGEAYNVDQVPFLAMMNAITCGKLPKPDCGICTVAGYRQVSGVPVVVVDRQTVTTRKQVKL